MSRSLLAVQSALLLSLLEVSLLTLTHGAYEPTICSSQPQPSPNPAPAHPILPDEFETHVVMNILTKNFSTEIHQFFSYSKDHSMMEQREYGQRYYGYADYQTNEFLGIFPDARNCTVSNLATNDNKFLFGYQKYTGAGAHVTTAYEMLHAFQPEDKATVYVGPKTARGIPCNMWYMCSYWTELDTTMNIYWYFSDPNLWTPSSTSGSIPVRAQVSGRRYLSPNNYRDFDHNYDFFHWKTSNLRNGYWETPRAVSCPGRVNTKQIPGIPKQFSFTLEQVDSDLGFISFMKEWYDTSRSLFRFQYRAGGTKADLFGDTTLSEVHDYTSGIAYVIDPQRGNCSIMPIESKSLDDRQASTKTVRLRSALEFFFLDGVNPSYEGVKQIRGIDADVWVANRPSSTGRGFDTWEWAFSTWTTEEQDLTGNNLPIPIQMTMSEGQGRTYFNLYDFQRKEPDPSVFDISPCYENRNRRIFQFGIAGNSVSAILQNLESFKNSVVTAVVKATGISPARVANVKVNLGTSPSIGVELLDKAPIKGDVMLKAPQIDLKTAGDRLYQAIRTNSFQIVIADGPNAVSTSVVKAQPSQIQEMEYQQTEKDEGVSTSSTAAVSVVMAVVGAGLGGGGATFFHNKFLNSIR